MKYFLRTVPLLSKGMGTCYDSREYDHLLNGTRCECVEKAFQLSFFFQGKEMQFQCWGE